MVPRLDVGRQMYMAGRSQPSGECDIPNVGEHADLRAMERVLADAVKRCAAGELTGCPVIDAPSAASFFVLRCPQAGGSRISGSFCRGPSYVGGPS
jgi:hypothetical protein